MLNLYIDKPARQEKKKPQVPNGSAAEVIKDSEEIVSEWVSEGLKPKVLASTPKPKREKPRSKSK